MKSILRLRSLLRCSQPCRRALNSAAFVSKPIPINDFTPEQRNELGSEATERCVLASLYRLVHLLNYDYEIYSHISLRAGVSKDKDEVFLINPFGLQYDEMTASSLVKIDVKGNIVSRGSTPLGVNRAGWILHGAIHEARPDVNCIIHVHTPQAVAIAATKNGLLPVTQEALIVQNVSYHSYHGIITDDVEVQELRKNFQAPSKVLILRNHGLLVAGSSPFEAWFQFFNAMRACQEQAYFLGMQDLVQPSQFAFDRTVAVIRKMLGGLKRSGVNMNSRHEAGDVPDWQIGELEFESWMRKLDRAGLRTGYPYRLKLPKSIWNLD